MLLAMNADDCPSSLNSNYGSSKSDDPSKMPTNRVLSFLVVLALYLISWMKRISALLQLRVWNLVAKFSIGGSVSNSKFAQVFVLDDITTCDAKLRSYLTKQPKLNFVGLDCEWVSRKGCSNAPVALLQMATPENDCFLVRLCKMGGTLPASVKKILEDRNILKFGVGIQGDAKKLCGTYGVNVSGCVDLRHVVLRCRSFKNSAQSAAEK